MDRAAFTAHRTDEAWTYGVAHRERLVREYMDAEGLTDRPLLKDVVDVLIEETQGARLREDVLPLDRYAQTECVGSRLEVTVNSRISAMEGVKHVAGVVHVAKWHESIHVECDFKDASPAIEDQPSLPGLDSEPVQMVACRGFHRNLPPERRASEFFAETAGVAAAVCREDLNRCPAWRNLSHRARKGGDLGWTELYASAEFIGVNPAAIVKFVEHHGLACVSRLDGHDKLVGNARLELEDG